ncbi:hypothetical protein M8C21_013352, partial [Ambrosia artemisiifolia]
WVKGPPLDETHRPQRNVRTIRRRNIHRSVVFVALPHRFPSFALSTCKPQSSRSLPLLNISVTVRYSMAPAVPRSGDAIFANVERVLLTDLEEVEEVNKQLDQMGYNIGIRLIDEFLAKSNVTRCVDFRETAEVIAKVGFKMFLGVTASVSNWDTEGTCCSLILE